MRSGFEDLDLDRLRRRRSEKWRLHPPDVLPAFIAEMDYDLAEPVLAALREALDLGDCGYAALLALATEPGDGVVIKWPPPSPDSSGWSGSLQVEGQALQAAQGGPGRAVDRRAGRPQPGEAAQQPGEQRLALHARQVGAQAVVRP